MSGARVALFVSLGVNVLLVGMVGGAMLADWRNAQTRGQAAVARTPNMRAVLESLPPERAQEVRGKVVAAWREGREERVAARRARAEVARIVGAPTYDVEAARRAFAQMRAADAAVAARFQDVVAESLATMTVTERRAVLRELVRRRAQGAMRLGAPPEAETTPAEPAP